MANKDDDEPGSSKRIPLLITRRQRADLREFGFSEDDISVMTPSDAHRHLAERDTGPTPFEPGLIEGFGKIACFRRP